MGRTTITLTRDGPLAVITLNRPDAMNAFTLVMGEELRAAFDETDADASVRAVIVTGTGKAFCAGADLSTGAETFNAMFQANASGTLNDRDPKWRDSGGMLNLRIFDSQKPVVAAINGASVGIGATMILPMDARIGLKGAKFAYPFTRRGIAWDGCASWFLPRIVGVETALDWGLSGRTFMAEEALEAGLVSALADTPEGVMELARERASRFVNGAAPVSVAMNRRLLWRMLGASHPMEAHRLESRAILHRGMSPDAVEGVMSFLEKRPAAFPGEVPGAFPPGWPWDADPDY
jgi:enoyl-CoA hydratase/carnithine racemase